MKNVADTLANRELIYGSYRRVAGISQMLKSVIANNTVSKRTPIQQESLDMICNKLARIVAGDPNYADSWHDIAGYATLVVEELER